MSPSTDTAVPSPVASSETDLGLPIVVCLHSTVGRRRLGSRATEEEEEGELPLALA